MKIAVAVSILLILPVSALAQETMAQAAERQKKARTGQPKAKVITEDELRTAGTKGYVPAAVAGSASPQPGASPGPTPSGAPAAAAPKSDDQLRAEKKAELEKKMKELTDWIAATKKAMDEAQLELNDLSNVTLGSRREGLQKVIDGGNKNLAEAQQAIADLQEQARRAGIPLR